MKIFFIENSDLPSQTVLDTIFLEKSLELTIPQFK